MYSFDFIFLSLIFKNNELTFFSFIIHILKCNFVCENYENFKSFFLLFLWIKCLINVMNCFLGILFVWEIWEKSKYESILSKAIHERQNFDTPNQLQGIQTSIMYSHFCWFVFLFNFSSDATSIIWIGKKTDRGSAQNYQQEIVSACCSKRTTKCCINPKPETNK